MPIFLFAGMLFLNSLFASVMREADYCPMSVFSVDGPCVSGQKAGITVLFGYTFFHGWMSSGRSKQFARATGGVRRSAAGYYDMIETCKTGKMIAHNVYEDFSNEHWVQVFTAQTMLIAFYYLALQTPIVWTERACFQWVAGVVLQQVAIDELGRQYNPKYFLLLLHLMPVVKFSDRSAAVRMVKNLPATYSTQDHVGNVTARSFCAAMANSTYLLFLMMSLPLLLATAETNMDFVMNAFAIAFITTLDDKDEPVEFTLEFDEELMDANELYTLATAETSDEQ